ncbi:MAG TPA: OmpA family protein [Spirochaetota bacterium]|nr:OmpA family protein [Spirochaetota bacterium]HPC39783.1 OmpA family protein [Spirochaetota bacterium]HQJ72716.1 OmpA family protein [Spirochaetota bacterium]HRS79138.1 OmpA family protein [Spirochaetota bacterium]HRT77037.1 OmpA family protein [Spirochaetota bacterium]
MKPGRAIVAVALFFWGAPLAAADGDATRQLRFKYAPGEKYRIVTEVDEDVLINGVLSHRSLILNKVAVETAEVKGGAGRLDCEFQMSESIQGRFNSFYLKESYRSQFWRDELGVFTIDPSYFMPVVRNVPRFLPGGVKPGDAWTGDAEEAHDFRRSYGIEKAFHFPVKVNYAYLRDEVKEGVKTAVLKVDFTIFHQVRYDGVPSGPVPVKITGISSQLFWWDIAAGQFLSYQEDFDFIFFLSNASTVEYRGRADGRLLKSPKLDRNKVADDINAIIKKDSIADAAVRKDRNGVTIVLENVQFPPNSPELMDAEKEKLSRIAGILKGFPERDFLVTGHTARVGEEQTSQSLSEQRAMAVADFLIAKGACKKTQVVTQGKGSREPAADNATEAGRKRNRRVEITILEN